MIASMPPSGPRTTPEDEEIRLVAALRAGDEPAFIAIVERYHQSLLRLALAYVADRAIAEEIVQETWLALMRGIARFEGRSSLKTWLFRVLVYQARARAGREDRFVPFSALPAPTVDPARFLPENHQWAGHWAEAVSSFEETPEEYFLRQETITRIRALIAALPARQRMVLVLRDIEGMSAAEACSILSINDGAARVLLHRARARLRQGIEDYVRGNEAVPADG